MIDTLPRKITPALRAFCRSIAPATPRFIRSKPGPDASASHCFDNVSAYVHGHGGSTAYGWAVWHFRGAFFEAEHHGVWSDPTGDLIDVTPQVNGYDRIVFLPDPPAEYDPVSFRSNRLQPEPGSRFGGRIVELARRRYALWDRYRAGGAKVAVLSPEDQLKLGVIDLELGPLLAAASTGTG